MNEKIGKRIRSKMQFAYDLQMEAGGDIGTVSDDDVINTLSDLMPNVDIFDATLSEPSNGKLSPDFVPVAVIGVNDLDVNSPFCITGEVQLRIMTRRGYLSGLSQSEFYLYMMAFQQFGWRGAEAMAECIVDGAQSGPWIKDIGPDDTSEGSTREGNRI